MTTPRYRLLALDIDGTLLTSARHVSPRVRRALDTARAAGCQLALVTGRRYPAALRVAAEVGGDPPLVLHNGALVVESGAVLRCVPLARRVALDAVRIGRAAGADPVVHCGQAGEGFLFVGAVSPGNALLDYYLGRSGDAVRRVATLETAFEEDPLQVMFGGPLEAIRDLEPRLRDGLGDTARLEKTVYPGRGVGILDVLDPSVGKAGAVAFLQERWGVRAAETLAVGDNWNDREMLERAGLGLVMGNADNGLKGLGLPTLPTNDEDGVAVAVERYVLAAAGK